MTQNLALIDYGSGNVHSAARALQAAGEGLDAPCDVTLTYDPEVILHADRIVLPGVGHFATCMQDLSAREGVIEALRVRVLNDGVPFLGICVGMQILAEIGLEGGESSGLGWIGGRVAPLPKTPTLPLPHMGWNSLDLGDEDPHPLLSGLGVDPHVYFVHSYQFEPTNPDVVVAQADYGATFAATIVQDNIAGVQFHPEKSQAKGLKILENFLNWRP